MAEKTTTTNTATPPKTFERNKYGLISDGSISYVYNEDGTINWRKMVKPEYLQPNKRVFKQRSKPVPDKIDGLADNELIILLGGLKELAQVRGYKAILPYQVTSPSNDYVIAVASIIWIPNFETEGREVQFSAIGDAGYHNTDDFGRKFLAAFAENRAFARCIRNFLKINIVSDEEIKGANDGEKIGDVADNLLEKTMNQNNITFADVQKRLVKEGMSGAESFTSIVDIPKWKQFELVGLIKSKVESRTTTPS